MTTQDLDFSSCENELIRTPGSIQPFGVMIVADDSLSLITHVSENSAAIFGTSATAIVGAELGSLLPSDTLLTIRNALQPESAVQTTFAVTISSADIPIQCNLHVHRANNVFILEFEPATTTVSNSGETEAKESSTQLRQATDILMAAPSFATFADALAEQMRRIINFDRVMVYRFDENWAGEVIAEAREPQLDPLKGQWFPATDIPAQARALYLENWIRTIGRASYEPVPLWTLPGSDTIDMSKAVLRSVSPVHIGYLKNMGVSASMSVSLIDNGKLWGLIACHNYSGPRPLSATVRNTAEQLGHLASKILIEKIASVDFANSLAVRTTYAILENALSNATSHEEVVAALTSSERTIADLIDASGAAVFADGIMTTVGDVPNKRWLRSIASTFQTTTYGECYSSNSLTRGNVELPQ